MSEGWSFFFETNSKIRIILTQNGHMVHQNEFIESLKNGSTDFIKNFINVVKAVTLKEFSLEFSPFSTDENLLFEMIPIPVIDDETKTNMILSENDRLYAPTINSIKEYFTQNDEGIIRRFFRAMAEFIILKMNESPSHNIYPRLESNGILSFAIYHQISSDRPEKPLEEIPRGSLLVSSNGIHLFGDIMRRSKSGGRFITYTLAYLNHPKLRFLNQTEWVEVMENGSFFEDALRHIPFDKYEIQIVKDSEFQFVAYENDYLLDHHSDDSGPNGVFVGDPKYVKESAVLMDNDLKGFWPVKMDDITNYAYLGAYLRTAKPTAVRNVFLELSRLMRLREKDWPVGVNIVTKDKWLYFELSSNINNATTELKELTIDYISSTFGWIMTSRIIGATRVPGINPKATLYELKTIGGIKVTWNAVMSLLQNDKSKISFFNLLINVLKDAPYSKYYLEMNVISTNSDNPFEFVMVEAGPELSDISDSTPFQNQINNTLPTDRITNFRNLEGSIDLVIPLPRDSRINYAHIASFTRSADLETQRLLWNRVLNLTRERLLSVPELWISTHGTGVHWLHVRINPKPKYYHVRSETLTPWKLSSSQPTTSVQESPRWTAPPALISPLRSGMASTFTPSKFSTEEKIPILSPPTPISIPPRAEFVPSSKTTPSLAPSIESPYLAPVWTTRSVLPTPTVGGLVPEKPLSFLLEPTTEEINSSLPASGPAPIVEEKTFPFNPISGILDL